MLSASFTSFSDCKIKSSTILLNAPGIFIWLVSFSYWKWILRRHMDCVDRILIISWHRSGWDLLHSTRELNCPFISLHFSHNQSVCKTFYLAYRGCFSVNTLIERKEMLGVRCLVTSRNYHLQGAGNCDIHIFDFHTPTQISYLMILWIIWNAITNLKIMRIYCNTFDETMFILGMKRMINHISWPQDPDF